MDSNIYKIVNNKTEDNYYCFGNMAYVSYGIAKVIKDNEVSEASQIVNIDKEAPIINEIKYNTNWSKSKEIEIKKNFAVFNDAKIAFRACSNRNGMIFISGTGSICFCVQHNNVYRNPF